jgi:hypothetical protein
MYWSRIIGPARQLEVHATAQDKRAHVHYAGLGTEHHNVTLALLPLRGCTIRVIVIAWLHRHCGEERVKARETQETERQNMPPDFPR